jgi:hypothetical protein
MAALPQASLLALLPLPDLQRLESPSTLSLALFFHACRATQCGPHTTVSILILLPHHSNKSTETERKPLKTSSSNLMEYFYAVYLRIKLHLNLGVFAFIVVYIVFL